MGFGIKKLFKKKERSGPSNPETDSEDGSYLRPMTFREKWRESLSSDPKAMWLYHKRIYALAFIIPALLMYAVYLAFQIHPVGDNSVLVLDLNGQYVYYYEAFRDAIKGKGSMFYSWNRILGGEMMGIFAYYLASPFSLIVALFPKAYILEGILLMQLCKLGACGVTFAFYMRRTRQRQGEYNVLLFSVLYAMMAYAVIQLMDPMWLDGLVYLPLIIYGIELLVDEGRSLWFTIPLGLMFFANYYIGWMVAIFSGIYFLVYYWLLSVKKEDDRGAKDFLWTAFRFGLGGIIAALLAGCILLPTYQSLKLGKLEFSDPDFGLKPQFTLFDFFSKLLPETYDTVRNEGLPAVYCGTLTIFMIPLYYLNKNISAKKKIGHTVLLASVLLSMYLSTIDLVWHGFQIPNWLPYRYSFTFSFVMLIMASDAFERIEGIEYKHIIGSLMGWGIYVLYLDTLKKDNLETTQAIWFSLVCLLGFAFLVYYYRKHSTQASVPLILLVLVVGELFAGNLQTLRDIDEDVTYSKYSSYVPYIKSGRVMMEEMYDLDNSFYRMEKTYHRTVNDAMAIKMRGMSHSSSALNAKPIALIDQLGLVSRGHYTKYKGSTPIVDDLFGIKYVATKDETVPYSEVVYTQPSEGISVYKNPNALSIGFMADDALLDLSLTKDNPFVNQNKLLSALVSGEYREFFKPIMVEDTEYENLDVSNYNDHKYYKVVDKAKNAQAKFIMTVPNKNRVYMYLPSTWENDLNIWANGEFKGQYYKTDNYTIREMGQYKPGETLEVITTVVSEYCYMRDQWFYELDEDMVNEAMSQLSQNQWNITKYSDTHLEGKVTAEKGQVLFTSIPYEPGWTIKVDGQKVEPIVLADALIGVELEPGEHTVTMVFFPNGLAPGLLLTGAGILMVIAMALYERKSRSVLLQRLYE